MFSSIKNLHKQSAQEPRWKKPRNQMFGSKLASSSEVKIVSLKSKIAQHELRGQDRQEKESERVDTWLKKREGNAETAILHDCYSQNTRREGPQKAKTRSQRKKVNELCYLCVSECLSVSLKNTSELRSDPNKKERARLNSDKWLLLFFLFFVVESCFCYFSSSLNGVVEEGGGNGIKSLKRKMCFAYWFVPHFDSLSLLSLALSLLFLFIGELFLQGILKVFF